MSIPVPKVVLERIAQRQAAGQGVGRGENYRGYVRVQDFYSFGEPVRWWSPKLKRQVETFSGEETTCGRLLLWSPTIVDMHEQFPLLPIEDTLKIAKDLDVEHPMEDGLPKVMTTDFHFEAVRDGRRWEGMRAYKPVAFLDDRNLVKLEIERRFAEMHGITDWGLVTNLDLPPVEAANVDLLSSYAKLDDVPGLVLPDPAPLLTALSRRLFGEPSRPICELCAVVDAEFGHPDTPKCLVAINHAYATGSWPLDIHVRYITTDPMHSRNLELLKNAIG